MRVKGISEIALPQILRGFLQRVAKAIEITTIVAIEEIVMSAITTTFVTTIVGFGFEFGFPPAQVGGALLGVLRSAGFCKGAPLKVLSLGKSHQDWWIEIGPQLMTAQYRPSITESFQARLTRLGANQGRGRKDRR